MTTTSRRHLGLFAFLFSLTLLGVLGSGCGSGPVPPTEFVAQADALHQSALRSAIATDSDVNEFIAEVGKRIVQGATSIDANFTRDPVLAKMEFHLVGSSVPNAFMTGGRHIYIFNRLFQACRSEEELAAVMAHEFAHAVNLDTPATGMKPSPSATPDKIAYSFVTYGFTAAMEQAADEKGFDFYARAGWDPAKFANIFERLQSPDVNGPDITPANTRVPLVQRAQAARERAAKLPPAARNWRQAPVADPQIFNFLKDKALVGGEGATPQNPAWLYLRAFPNCLLPSDIPAQQSAQQQLKILVSPPPTAKPAQEPS